MLRRPGWGVRIDTDLTETYEEAPTWSHRCADSGIAAGAREIFSIQASVCPRVGPELPACICSPALWPTWSAFLVFPGDRRSGTGLASCPDYADLLCQILPVPDLAGV